MRDHLKWVILYRWAGVFRDSWSSSATGAIRRVEMRVDRALTVALVVAFLFWPLIVEFSFTESLRLWYWVPLNGAVVISFTWPFLRMWEERQSGVLSWLRGLPIDSREFIWGKFTADLTLSWTMLGAAIPSLMVALVQLRIPRMLFWFLVLAMILVLLFIAIGLMISVGFQLWAAISPRHPRDTIPWMILQLLFFMSVVGLPSIIETSSEFWWMCLLIFLGCILVFGLLITPLVTVYFLRQAVRCIDEME